jgi:hypothetical protein
MEERNELKVFEEQALDSYSEFLNYYGFLYSKNLGGKSSSRFMHRFKRGDKFVDIAGRMKSKTKPEIIVTVGDTSIVDGRRNSLQLDELFKFPSQWKKLFDEKYGEAENSRQIIINSLKRLKLAAMDFLNGHEYYLKRAINGDLKEVSARKHLQNFVINFLLIFALVPSSYYYIKYGKKIEKGEVEALIAEFEQLESELRGKIGKQVDNISFFDSYKESEPVNMSEEDIYFFDIVKNGDLLKAAEIIKQGYEPIGKVDERNHGASALHVAVMSGQRGLVSFFLKYGIDVNTIDKYGRTALHLTSYHGNNELTRFLIENGAEINLRDLSGDTPLHINVRKNFPPDIAIIKTLIDAGADLQIRDANGLSVLEKAVDYNHTGLSKFLIKNYGAALGVFSDEAGLE